MLLATGQSYLLELTGHSCSRSLSKLLGGVSIDVLIATKMA